MRTRVLVSLPLVSVQLRATMELALYGQSVFQDHRFSLDDAQRRRRLVQDAIAEDEPGYGELPSAAVPELNSNAYWTAQIRFARERELRAPPESLALPPPPAVRHIGALDTAGSARAAAAAALPLSASHVAREMRLTVGDLQAWKKKDISERATLTA